MDSNTAVLRFLQQRTESQVKQGNDGYVDTKMLAFDVGLNTRTVRGILESAVDEGLVTRKERGPGRAFKYRSLAEPLVL
jgi:predicted ArsR family transcriptional regulator